MGATTAAETAPLTASAHAEPGSAASAQTRAAGVFPPASAQASPSPSPQKREAWQDYSSVFTAAKAGMQNVDKEHVKKVRMKAPLGTTSYWHMPSHLLPHA